MALDWFKVDVNFASHPKLVRLAALMPDATGIIIRLWTWTARYAPTGCVTSSVTSALDEELSRGVFEDDGQRIEAGKALESVIETGWVERDGNGDVTVHDWAEMQPDHVDSKDKKREQTRLRVAKLRARNASVTQAGNADVTHVTLLEEKRREEKRLERTKEDHAAPKAGAVVVPVGPTIAELSADWPPEKLVACRNAIASARTSGKISDGPWRAFLLKANQFALPIRLRAVDTYIDNAYWAQGKKEPYLLGIMRGENNPSPQQGPRRGFVPITGTTAMHEGQKPEEWFTEKLEAGGKRG